MFGFGKPKERQRFYLLPGMGGRALRRKNRVFFWWAVVAGLAASGMMASVLYILSRR